MHGPSYPTLFKEFWKYTTFNSNGVFISSTIFRIPFIINHISISTAIFCSSPGDIFEDFRVRYYREEKLNTIHDTSRSYTPTDPETILPTAATWFKFVLNNVRPKRFNMKSLEIDGRVLNYYLMNHIKFNLPQTIFNYLKGYIVISRNHQQSFIPFGRVLCNSSSRLRLLDQFASMDPKKTLEEVRCKILSI